MSSNAESVRAVERATQMLVVLAETGPLRLSDIAQRLGLAKSVVHRTLTALCTTGFAEQEAGSRLYRLGPRLVELGAAALGSPEITSLAHPILTMLARSTSETATLSLLIGHQRVYAAQVPGKQVVRMEVELGPRYPLYAGASGRAILAMLPTHEQEHFFENVKLARITDATIVDADTLHEAIEEVGVRGYAISSGERDPWAASVAAPVFRNGRVIGSLSVCGPRPRFDAATAKRHAKATLRAAQELSARVSTPVQPGEVTASVRL